MMPLGDIQFDTRVISDDRLVMLGGIAFDVVNQQNNKYPARAFKLSGKPFSQTLNSTSINSSEFDSSAGAAIDKPN